MSKRHHHCEPCGESFEHPSRLKKHLTCASHLKCLQDLRLLQQYYEVIDTGDNQPQSQSTEEQTHGDEFETESMSQAENTNSDSEDDMDIEDFENYLADIEELSSGSYKPFPSKTFALLYFLVHSPHPVPSRMLNFIWFILKQLGITVPSLVSVKNFQLPNMESASLHVSAKGMPFYCIPATSIIRQCLGRIDISHNLVRFPVQKQDTVTEMYHASAWCSDPRFFSPMVKLIDGTSVFLGDCVFFQSGDLGQVTGLVKKFYHEMTLDSIFAEMDMLLDLHQFKLMISHTTVVHIDSDTRILFDTISKPVCHIIGLAERPEHVIKLVPSDSGFARMDSEETAAYLASHPLKKRAEGKRVVMVPLILFTDDTSGNRSKKWHKFDSWYLSLAGLSRHFNARHENIHFLCTSDNASSLDMSMSIAQELVSLETEGAFVFDALYEEVVLVVAPVMCMVCDNPKASELVNHLGSGALKNCRICMSSKTENPDAVCQFRTKAASLDQIALIKSQSTEREKIKMRKTCGLREDDNPLLSLSADLYQSTPVEVLHTILLGSCKHILKVIMPKMSPLNKKEILARVSAFSKSGISCRLYGNVCQYFQSFVGRDFKGWAQMSVFILSPYLDEGDRKVLLAFMKVFKIAYCNFFQPSLIEEWKKVCTDFVDAVKLYMPVLMEKQKTHLILHLVDCMVRFGPSSAFSAERFESFNSSVRNFNVFGNRHSPSRDIGKRFSIIQHLRFICNSGSTNERCGNALKELYSTPIVQSMLTGISTQELLNQKRIYQPGVARKASMCSKSLSKLLLVTTEKVITLENLLQCGLYSLNLGSITPLDIVTEHHAVMSQEPSLVNSGSFVELMAQHDNIQYGILVGIFKHSNNSVYCLIQGFKQLLFNNGQPLLNDYECPLLDLTTTIVCLPAKEVRRAVSLVHECSDTCTFKDTAVPSTVERQEVPLNKLLFVHDWCNTMYCYNIYCML